jgi:hypothetical protein
VAELEDGFETTYTYPVPESVATSHSFPDATTDYVSLPPASSDYLPSGYHCAQSYSSTHSDVNLNFANGLFTLTNVPTAK